MPTPPSPAHLARVLGVPLERLTRAIDEAGVDLEFLARAAREGDPFGAIGSVAARLDRTRMDVFLALAEVSDLLPAEVAASAERMGLDMGDLASRLRARSPGGAPRPAVRATPAAAAAALHLAESAKRGTAQNLTAALVAFGLALIASAAVAFLWPAAVQQVLWEAFLLLLFLSGAAFVLGGLRFGLVAASARRAAAHSRIRAELEAQAAGGAPAGGGSAKGAVEEAWRAYRRPSAEGTRVGSREP